MFVICINKLALKIMKKKRNDLVASPIIKQVFFTVIANYFRVS